MTIPRVVAALLGASVVVLAGALLPGRSVPAQSVAPVLRARAIELVDDAGVVRAQLDVESGGEVVLRLRDAGGAIRVKLGASADGSGLVLLDDATEPGIHMLARRSGTSVTLKQGQRQRIIKP